MAKKVTEEQLLKALNELEGAGADDGAGDDEAEVEETKVVVKSKGKTKKAAPPPADDESDDEESDDEESMDKAHTDASPGMPDDTKEANGGFKKQKGASEDAENFETGADEVDPTGASMKSLVQDDSTLRKGFEVSSFLESLTDATVESVDGLRKSQADFQNEQRAFNARLQTAVVAIGNMMLGVQKSQVEAGEEPVVVRPRAVLRKSEVAERFSAEGNNEGPQFTREQTLDALIDLAQKGEIPSIAVSAYEADGHVERAITGQLNGKLKQLFG